MADAILQEAQDARVAAAPDNLSAREEAEIRTEDAKRAERRAQRAEKQRPNTKAGSGPAVSLRTTRRPVLTDPVKAATFFWNRERTEMEAFLTTLAERYTRAKKPAEGFEIIAEQSVA